MHRRMFLSFFILALLFRLAIAYESGWYQKLKHTEMEGIALNVVEFGDYTLYGVPSAYCTPVFPLYLAGLFSVFGAGLLGQAVKVTLTCMVSALRCGLVPLFAIDAGLDRKIGLIAGWLSVFYIGALDTEVSGGVDGPFVAIALLVLIWVIMRGWRDGSWQKRMPWWFYPFCGLSGLLNPSLFPVMGGFLVAGAVACPVPARKRYFRQAALVVAGIVAFLLPWTIRNYVELGAPVVTRSNFGTEFWVSNGPGRTFDHPTNYDTYHPSSNPAEAAKVAELGEVEYSRVRFAEGMEWVRANPGGFLRFVAERIAAWWFPPHPPAFLAPKLILTLLAFAGLWMMFRIQPVVAWLFLITWITFPDVYYVLHWSSRYRYPMDWQILLCASVALFAIWQLVGRGSHPVESRDHKEALPVRS